MSALSTRAGNARHAQMRDLPPSVRILAAAAIALPLGLAANGAHAQDATAQPATAQPAAVEEVVVTGSRVARTGFVTPTPTTVVGQTLMQQNADPSIAGTLETLPSFRASNSKATTGPNANGTPGSSYANLRGLGATRTLLLINGERWVPTSNTGTVDLNTIPSLLIDRVDVVTGGASAAYGSDAVAGVVNIILDKRINGVRGDISYGESAHNDNVDRRVALAAGTDFADGRGHAEIGGEYERNMGAGLVTTRDWGRESYGLLPNPNVSAAHPASPSNPKNLLVPLYQPSNLYVGGLIPSGPLKGVTTEAGGVVGRFDYGNIVGPSFMSGGSNYYVQYWNTNILAPSTRKNVLGRLDFDVSDNLSLYAQASWAESHSVNRGGTPRDTGTLTIHTDNPFMPAALRTMMQNAGLTTAPFGRYNFDLGASINDADVKVKRLSVGANGRIGDHWSWDAYAAYGKTNYVQYTRNVRINSRWFDAIDVVTNPANGQAICRSTLTDPTNGCVPANIFGVGTISQAARDWINGDEFYKAYYKQKVVAANLRGDPFSTWAGPVSVAVGAEHREENIGGDADAGSKARIWYVGNNVPVVGSVKVTEGYVEAVTPLLADMPFFKKVELDTAVRRTHYSTSGSVTTWKVGLNWELNDQVRFRATKSRDIRAPNLNELFSPGGNTITGIVNPANPGSAPLVRQVIGGNPDLKFEVAKTTTAGIVLRPDFIPGFDLSIDYYKIDLRDAVGSLAGQQIADGCYAGVQDLCKLITLSGGSTLATGTITSIFRPNINIATVNTKGWDIESRYRVPIDSFDMPGSLTLQLYATYLQSQKVDDGTGAVIDYAGETGNYFAAFGGPKWRGTFLATYANGPFSITGSWRYVGSGKYRTDWGPTDIDDNHMASRVYTNVSATYDIVDNGGKKVTVYGLVQNLLDKDPPRSGTIAWPTNPQYFDLIGRTYKVGLRFNF